MNAATPTPSSPEMAWVTGRPRTNRKIAITSAAATAAPMPQPNPAIALTTTNTTTGSPESTNPIGPPSCSQMVGTAGSGALSAVDCCSDDRCSVGGYSVDGYSVDGYWRRWVLGRLLLRRLMVGRPLLGPLRRRILALVTLRHAWTGISS